RLAAGPRSRKTACSPDPQEPLSPRPDAIRVHADQLPDILRTSDVSKTSLRQDIGIKSQPAADRKGSWKNISGEDDTTSARDRRLADCGDGFDFDEPKNFGQRSFW